MSNGNAIASGCERFPFFFFFFFSFFFSVLLSRQRRGAPASDTVAPCNKLSQNYAMNLIMSGAIATTIYARDSSGRLVHSRTLGNLHVNGTNNNRARLQRIALISVPPSLPPSSSSLSLSFSFPLVKRLYNS